MKKAVAILIVIIMVAIMVLPFIEQITTKTEDNHIYSLDNVLQDMSLKEKVCQLFIVAPEAISGQDATTDISQEFNDGYSNLPVGGIILFAKNILNREQVKKLLSDLENIGNIPMFLSVDQEGGTVARLNENVDFPIFDNMYNYRDDGTDTAYQNSKTIADELRQLGFNLDFAPVADVWSNPDNTIIGKRAYSDDFNQAADLVSSAVKGFSDGNIISTLKHFPGHGDTSVDTHNDIAFVKKTKEQLNEQEIIPFKAGINSGAEMVMVGHLVICDIDPEKPATISRAVISDYLKDELGYNGIVISDAFNMSAVSKEYSSGELAVMGLDAGLDIILMPENLNEAVDAVINAIEVGTLSEERINESVIKILKLKEKYGLLN